MSEPDQELEAAVEHNAELSLLTHSRAWGMLLAFVADQTQRRMNEIMLTPMLTQEEVLRHNFWRGECAGLNLVKGFMESELKVSQEAVALYRQAASEGDR